TASPGTCGTERGSSGPGTSRILPRSLLWLRSSVHPRVEVRLAVHGLARGQRVGAVDDLVLGREAALADEVLDVDRGVHPQPQRPDEEGGEQRHAPGLPRREAARAAEDEQRPEGRQRVEHGEEQSAFHSFTPSRSFTTSLARRRASVYISPLAAASFGPVREVRRSSGRLPPSDAMARMRAKAWCNLAARSSDLFSVAIAVPHPTWYRFRERPRRLVGAQRLERLGVGQRRQRRRQPVQELVQEAVELAVRHLLRHEGIGQFLRPGALPQRIEYLCTRSSICSCVNTSALTWLCQ